MEKDYPKYYEYLKGLVKNLRSELPGTIGGFGQLHEHATRDGALSKKTKELIALGIAIGVRCDGCIAYHVHDALKAGSSRNETLEAIGVAVMMGGGPALMYGCEALAAMDQFQEASK